MKKLLVLVSLCLSLLSCNSNNTQTNNNYKNTILVEVERINSTITIVYDKDTKVMYVYSYYGGTTPLYNADGSLKLYKE